MKKGNLKYLFFNLFLIITCSDIKRPPLYLAFLSLGKTGGERIGVVGTDFGSSGRFSVLNQSLNLNFPGFVSIHSDALGKYIDITNKVYIINRLNRDNIQVLNLNLYFITDLQFSTGKATNPQDIVLVSSNKAYITLYNAKTLLL
jgi:hypothetical protein